MSLFIDDLGNRYFYLIQSKFKAGSKEMCKLSWRFALANSHTHDPCINVSSTLLWVAQGPISVLVVQSSPTIRPVTHVINSSSNPKIRLLQHTLLCH